MPADSSRTLRSLTASSHVSTKTAVESTGIDPWTGTATVWVAADDTAFASVRHLAAGQPSGAWLIEPGTARLFDGERFAATLALPDGYRQDDEPGSTVADLLQVGETVYVAGRAGVARWSGGTWKPIGADRLVAAGHLAVDTAGAVWAGGTLVDWTGSGRTNVVVRLDGGTWTPPGAEDGAPTGEVGDVAADPARRRLDNVHGRGHCRPRRVPVRRDVVAEGRRRRLRPRPRRDHHGRGLGDGQRRRRPLSALGIFTASRLGADGSWQLFDGPPLTDEGSSADLAVSGDRVLMVHEEGLEALSGERFVPTWANPAAVVGTAFGVGPDRLIRISADELWMRTNYPSGPDGIVPATGLGHYMAGTWRTVDVPMWGERRSHRCWPATARCGRPAQTGSTGWSASTPRWSQPTRAAMSTTPATWVVGEAAINRADTAARLLPNHVHRAEDPRGADVLHSAACRAPPPRHRGMIVA